MKNASHSSASSMLRFACLGFWLHFGKIYDIQYDDIKQSISFFILRITKNTNEGLTTDKIETAL